MSIQQKEESADKLASHGNEVVPDGVWNTFQPGRPFVFAFDILLWW